MPIQCDIACENDVVRMFEIIKQQRGELHYLVNNAGVLFQQCTTAELTAERIFNLCCARIQFMRKIIRIMLF